MPLGFHSASHGPVAFGYFNIETDLLLLQDRFFFTDAFCDAVAALARGAGRAPFEGWHLTRQADIGDLHGAIAGVRLEGLIGETYRRWPFPQDPAGFKQSTDGRANRDAARAMIEAYAPATTLEATRDPDTGEVTLADHRFDAAEARRLVAYVRRGGYPRWRDDQPPPEVVALMDTLAGTPLHPDA